MMRGATGLRVGGGWRTLPGSPHPAGSIRSPLNRHECIMPWKLVLLLGSQATCPPPLRVPQFAMAFRHDPEGPVMCNKAVGIFLLLFCDALAGVPPSLLLAGGVRAPRCRQRRYVRRGRDRLRGECLHGGVRGSRLRCRDLPRPVLRRGRERRGERGFRGHPKSHDLLGLHPEWRRIWRGLWRQLCCVWYSQTRPSPLG